MARTAVLERLNWKLGEVVELIDETPRVRSIIFDIPGWTGHRAGQHVDVRLTAEDGYQAQRSYSIASPPEQNRLMLTVERLSDGEVSPYLVDELRPGDVIELRGPIGGYFVWEARICGPLLLVAGGSGIVPLMAMLRHRAASGSTEPARLIYSSRSFEDIIFREELERLTARSDGVDVIHTLTRSQPLEWNGYARRIDAQMLADTAFPPASRPMSYICGPTSFVEAAESVKIPIGRLTSSVLTSTDRRFDVEHAPCELLKKIRDRLGSEPTATDAPPRHSSYFSPL
jgi:ferredoxin-NADP reductase